MNKTYERLMLALCVFTLSACTTTTTPTPSNPSDAGVLAQSATPNLPAVATRAAQVQAALGNNPPVLILTDGVDDAQRAAEDLAVQDARFQKVYRDPTTNEAFRNEIFGVYPTRESDITPATTACRQSKCYRVEMYNYALNLTLVAIVALNARTVLAVNQIPETQPDLPPHLTDLAVQIATNAPEVAQALGTKPISGTAMMADTKTALNQTICERSRHLCVAPTFIQGSRALWAIVDLTDSRLVGVRWTELGASSGHPITEKQLENDVVSARYCETNTQLARNGWELNYILTSSDGLRISEVRFQNKPMLDSAKLVDWHVSYSGVDGFGYSDAAGCPVFSQAAVISYGPPQVEDLQQNGNSVGFVLRQEFQSEEWPLPCNYNYEQRYEFYNDGRFRVVAGSLGRGCGNNGTYRPVLRIAFAGVYTMAQWDGTAWKDWAVEQWSLQQPDSAYTPEGYLYRLADQAGAGYYIDPNRGQFGDGSRGDNAYVYATLHHANLDEGDSDMVTIGSCCNTDYHQGPEKFIDPTPEPILSSPLVIWYVPQLKNDDTPGHEYCWADSVLVAGVYTAKVWPCYAGPMFVPIQK